MRYLPLTDDDRRAMLATVGARGIDDLYADVPEAALLADPVDLPLHAGEIEVERRIGAFAARNLGASSAPFFLGAGNYHHHIPAAVDHLIQRSEFLTSYTPYQPEISQGTLQALFEFQTQVALITGMEVANASLYDGATACAEAGGWTGWRSWGLRGSCNVSRYLDDSSRGVWDKSGAGGWTRGEGLALPYRSV